MKKIVVSILVFIGCLGTIALFSRENENNGTRLAEARKLVEQKSYGQALEIYSRLESWLNRDPDLSIEWARVYTYADRHPEAIAIFQRVIRNFPEQAKGIYKELADQYKWNGQPGLAIQAYDQALARSPGAVDILLGRAQAYAWNDQKPKALKEFDSILKTHPGNIDAMNDKAEVLSWMDRLKASNRLYAEVLALAHDNAKAMNGQARILVWGGFHRKGIRRYRQVLGRYPENEEALEGLAFAQHWDGQDSRAVLTLQKLLKINPRHKEAAKLNFAIHNSQKPFVNNFNRYSKDKNDQAVSNLGIRSGFHAGYDFSIEGIISRQAYHKPQRNWIYNTKPGLGTHLRIGTIFEINSFLYANDFRAVNFKPFTTNTWFTIKPNDVWRFDLSYDHETFEDIDALINHISTDNAGISFDFKPDRFWFLSGKYRDSFYSDKNRQNMFFSKLEYRLLRKPYVKMYYNFYSSTWKFQLNNGYFNPKSIVSHTLGVYSGFSLNYKIFMEAQAAIGHEVQKPSANRPTYYLGGSVNYRLSENWNIFLHGDFFDARPDLYSNGYYRKYVEIGLTYNFGAGHTGIQEASRPSRTPLSQ